MMQFKLTCCWELDRVVEELKNRAQIAQKWADMINTQLPHRNQIALKEYEKQTRSLGKVLGDCMADIQRVECTGRVRDNTWAKGGDRVARRRMRNTMGYQMVGDRP